MAPIKRIAVLTSGGDAPGMNACIATIAHCAEARGVGIRGMRRGKRDDSLANAPFREQVATENEERYGDQDKGLHPGDEAEENRFEWMRKSVQPDHPDSGGQECIHQRHTRQRNDQKHEEYNECKHRSTSVAFFA